MVLTSTKQRRLLDRRHRFLKSPCAISKNQLPFFYFASPSELHRGDPGRKRAPTDARRDCTGGEN